VSDLNSHNPFSSVWALGVEGAACMLSFVELLVVDLDNIRDDVGVLDWQTYQGGTRGSRLCGEDRDRETENSKVCART
jgi:hypothetical protein